MYIILKNIHQSVTIDCLASYLKPFLEGGFFRRKGKLRAIVIIQLINKSGAYIERHALIRVCSDKIKKRLIKDLNKQSYVDDEGQKQKVQAAEYAIRQIMNERRASGLKELRVQRDLRKSERRRLGLKVVHVAEKEFIGSC